MIPRILPLLVARLVLLVHNDRAKILERREDGRPRPDDYPLVTSLQREPRVVSLTIAQGRMENRDSISENCAKPVDGLRSERDLRNEDDRCLAAPVHDLAEQLDVHQRLSAAGYPVQEEYVARRRVLQRFDCARLRRGRHVGTRRLTHAKREGITVDFLRFDDDEPSLFEGLEHRGRERKLQHEVLNGARSSERLEHLEHRPLLWSPGECLIAVRQRRQVLSQPYHPMRLSRGLRLGSASERSGERRAKRNSERNYVVVRHPPAERDHLRAQGRRTVRNLDYALDLLYGVS